MTAVSLAEALSDPMAVWLTSVIWPSSVVSEWRGPFGPGDEVRAKGVDVWLPGHLGFTVLSGGDGKAAIITPDHGKAAFASIDWVHYDIHTLSKSQYAKFIKWFIFWGRKNGARIRLWVPISSDLVDFLEEENPPEIKLGEAKLTRWKRP